MAESSDDKNKPNQSFLNPPIDPNDENLVPDYQHLFADVKVRHALIRKMYTIVISQLLIIIGMVCLVYFYKKIDKFFQDYHWLHMFSFVIGWISFTLLDVEKIRFKFPINLILIYTATTFFGFTLAFVQENYRIIVFSSLAMFFIVFVGLLFFTLQSTKEFGHKVYLGVLILIFIVYIPLVILNKDIAVYLTIQTFIQFVYTCLLVSNTKAVTSGNYRVAFKPSEFIVATACLYSESLLFKSKVKLRQQSNN